MSILSKLNEMRKIRTNEDSSGVGIFSAPEEFDDELEQIDFVKAELEESFGEQVKERFGEESDAVLVAMAKQRLAALRERAIEESQEDYYKTYSDAVKAAIARIPKEFSYNDDEYHSVIATGSKKPNYDQTVRWKLPLYNSKGDHKKYLVVSVYNRSKDGSGKPYELTAYVS